ncbi:hypothetical protein BDV95DRAFT_487818 [Massariosphaeria phaeospora]|uniref:J domain-containing protein n=1 Tax=Massariosphaeria phaeospora TaxID=100035 RepID=A0A7C8I9Y7_9PLEO|nr:hypothetical protein BDV95DRAFT_487818 [Massariosphaeria phaeospora]
MARKGRSAAAQAVKEDAAFIDEEENIDADDGPPSVQPYEVLGLETEATADEVKKAYRKLALKHHPDKAQDSDKEAANKKFQEIAFAYAVLSDDRRRKRYDLTGSTAETLEDDDDFNWLKFYRQQFEDVVTEESITRIANEYKGSAEERRDLLKAYDEHEGRLSAIYQVVMLSDILEDDDRFRQILDEEIAKGTVETYPTYERENKDELRQKAKDAERKKREDFDKRHNKEVEEKSKANGKANGKAKSKKREPGSFADLAALIQQRQKARAGNFFEDVEARYAQPSRGSKRATPMDEPPEEAFAAMGARASKKNKPNTRTKKAHNYDESGEDIGDEDSEEEEEEAPKPKKRGRLQRGRRRAKAKA